MKFGAILGIVFALMLHGGFILFGGLIFPRAKVSEASLQQVALLSEDETKEEESEQKPEQPPEEVGSDQEPPPDAEEILNAIDLSSTADAPALDAFSLSALEAALNGTGGMSEFDTSADLRGGGVIGGTGTPGQSMSEADEAFNLDEIDQQPRLLYQPPPAYPSEARSQRLEGVVSIKFIVDDTGKVSHARVEKSTHPAFEKPALEAVRKSKFEPGLRGGKPVAASKRQTFRFQPS